MIRRSVTILLAGLLVSSAARSQEDARSLSVIGLRAEEPDRDVQGFGLLYREVLRQSVLLAAREELGLPTRDQALREPLPEGAATLGFHVKVTAKGVLQVSLSRGEAEARKTIWETSMDLPPGRPCSVRDLAPLVEPLSRGPIVDALKKAGFAGKPAEKVPAAELPAGVEQRLRELTFSEPYAALRDLHAACRATGESPARLGAIVRGYAHLGQLSRGLWNASSKVFAARSLLYAERLVASAPGSRGGLWHRAYASTLAGLPKAALDDLAGAAALADSKEEPPAWVPWIEACCKGDTPKLEIGGLAEDRGLQRFLAFLTVEHSDSPGFERSKILETLKLNPECYRLVDALCAVGGISNLHEATMIGPAILGNRIYGRVAKQPDLPKRVKDALRARDSGAPEQQVRTLVWKALLSSPEPVEPSWAVLGRFVEETSFMQTVSRGHFMRHQWSVPCAEFVNEVSPLIADHPYRALVRSYALDFGRQREEWFALFDKLQLGEVTETLQPLSSATWNLQPRNLVGKKIWDLVWSHLDTTAPDLRWVLSRTNRDKPDDRRKYAGLLIAVDPYSATAVAELVERDWEKMAPRAAELEKSLGHQPAVLNALGRRYRELKRADDALRCLKQETVVAPSLRASRALAEFYWAEADEQKWQETLEKFLESEDVGLDHASVRVELANHFMKRGKYDKAEPFAAAAAETWAAWAMICARDCYEGLGDWKKAELWQQRTSERYESQQTDWFFWCKRHEKGDVEAAEALALQYFKELMPRAKGADFEKLAVVHALSGRSREALTYFQKALDETNNPYDGLHTALLAMSLKDGEARAAALGQVLEKGPGYVKAKNHKGPEVELAKEFRDLLELGPGAAPNPGVFDRILQQTAEAGARANAAYFIGRFLELHRSAAEARPYYEEALKTNQPQRWNVLLSKEALKKKP